MTSPTPARVSGPAQFSQRTDNGQAIRHIADAKYGEDKAFVEQQKSAPLADGPDRPSMPPMSAGSAPAGPANGPREEPPPIIPLSASTQNPGQHVTTGMQMSPQPKQRPELKPDQLSEALAPYFAADDTGVLGFLAWQLAEMGL